MKVINEDGSSLLESDKCKVIAEMGIFVEDMPEVTLVQRVVYDKPINIMQFENE